MEKKKPKEAINLFEKIMKASVKEKKDIKPKKIAKKTSDKRCGKD